jgi:hypothetical protein
MDAQRHRAGDTPNRQLARQNRFVRAGKLDLLSRESNPSDVSVRRESPHS